MSLSLFGVKPTETDILIKILKGNEKKLNIVERIRIVQKFKDWIGTRKGLFRTATPHATTLRENLLRRKKAFEYDVRCRKFAPDPELGYEIFKEDVFTQIFQISQSLDDYSVGAQVTDVLALSGVQINEPIKFYVHVKVTYSNSKMGKAIKLFDIYQKKNSL